MASIGFHNAVKISVHLTHWHVNNKRRPHYDSLTIKAVDDTGAEVEISMYLEPNCVVEGIAVLPEATHFVDARKQVA